MRPPFKIHGGKRYLADWIISLFPQDYETYDYIEPFIGAGSVFLNKNKAQEGRIEVINDINLGVCQIFRALRDEPEHFINRLKNITYSQRVFTRELKRQGGHYEDYLDHAVNEFIVRRMSRGGLKKQFGWSERERGGQPGDVNAWKTIIKILPDIAKRVENVRIFNKPANKIISSFDTDKTLCVCDPPYLPSTRVAKNAYEDEMTVKDHEKLAEELKKFRGKVILCGYPSATYDNLYEGWKCHKKKIANHASQQKSKEIKVECCWTNF